MRRLLFVVTLLFGVILGITPGLLSARETIKIGVILPLTGVQAKNGENMRDTVLMWQQDQRQKAEESYRYNYQLLIEDGQNLPRNSVEAFHKLTSIDKVDALVTMYGGPGAAIAPIANSKKIIHIGGGFSTAIAQRPYCFNNFSKAETNAQRTADFCQKAGFKHVAFISQQYSSTNSLEEAFAKEAKARGIQVVNTQKFSPPEKDFRVALLKIRESRPDVLFVHAFDPEAAIIVRQMKEIGYRVPLTAMAHWGTFNNPDFYNIPYSESIASADFERKFLARYKHSAVYFSGMIYDSLEMLKSAYESYPGPGKPTSDYLAKYISSLKEFPGVMGTLTPDADGWFDSPSCMVIQNDQGRKEISMEEAVELVKKQSL